MKIKSFDISVLLLGMALLLVGMFQLDRIRFQNDFGDRGHPIAVVRESQNTVKKKSAMDLGWLDAWEGEPLFNKDQVFTYEGSGASVEFIEGPEIVVAEKTLFKVQLDQGVLNLDLADGIIFARIDQKTGPLQVSIKNKIYRLESKMARIQLSRNEESSEVQVVEGEATISSGSDSTHVGENQKIELNEASLSGSEKIEVAAIDLKAPELEEIPKNFTFYNLDESPLIKWNEVEGAKSYRIEIKNKQSEAVVSSESVNGTSYVMPANSGEFEVRVASVDRSGKVHDYTDFKSLKLDYGVWNEKDGVVKIELRKPDQLVDFNWEGEESKGEFLFELSATSDFRKILTEKRLDQPRTQHYFANMGEFYWRARELKKDGKAVFRKPVKVIVKPTPPPLKPVLEKELKLKIRQKKTSFFQLLFELFVASAFGDEVYVDIPMPEVPDAKKYLIEIYADADQKKLVKKGTTSKGPFRWNNVEKGTYFIKVAIVDFWERQSPFSDLSKIIIEPGEIKTQPKRGQVKLLKPKHGYKLSGDKLNFQWDSEKGEGYVLQISEDTDFKNPLLEKSVDGKKLTIERDELPETFYWRVLEGGGESYKRRVEVVTIKTSEKKSASKENSKEGLLGQKSTRYSVAYRPTLTEYGTTVSSSQVNIDGTALNGIEFGYEKTRGDRNIYGIHFVRTGGSVFETLNFHRHSLRAKYGDFLHGLPFQLKINVGIEELTQYFVQNNSVVEESGILFRLGGGLHYPFSFWKMNGGSFLNLEYGNSTLMELGVNLHYPLQNRLSLLGGVAFSSTDFDTDNGQAELSEISFLFGISKQL